MSCSRTNTETVYQFTAIAVRSFPTSPELCSQDLFVSHCFRLLYPTFLLAISSHMKLHSRAFFDISAQERVRELPSGRLSLFLHELSKNQSACSISCALLSALSKRPSSLPVDQRVVATVELFMQHTCRSPSTSPNAVLGTFISPLAHSRDLAVYEEILG